jgi:fatty acid desaturase
MKQAQWIREGIVRGRSFAANRQAPLSHNAVNLSLFALILLAFIAVALSKKVTPIAMYIPLGSLAFGYLFNLLATLVVHEASHNIFVLSKDSNRATFWNRLFGWMASIPIGLNYQEQWEKGHILHHLRIAETHDPETCHPRTGKALFIKVAKVLLIPGYVHFYGIFSGKGVNFECTENEIRPRNLRLMLGVVAFWTTVVLLVRDHVPMEEIISVGVAIFLGMQVGVAFNVLRESLDHGGVTVAKNNIYLRAHTTLSSVRHLIQPLNVSFQFEHHLNSNVPWYNLRKYHEALKQVVPPQLQPFLYTTGLQGVIRQMSGNNAPIPTDVI